MNRDLLCNVKPTWCATYSYYISSTFTCFGRIYTHHQKVQRYLYNNWYLLLFLDDCLLSWLDWKYTKNNLTVVIPMCFSNSYKIYVSVKQQFISKIMLTATCFDSNESISGHPWDLRQVLLKFIPNSYTSDICSSISSIK